MSGGKGGAPSNATAENAQAGLATQLTSLLGQEQGQSQQLFNLAFPGQAQAEQFYGALASGSPNLISAVTAPAAQQIQQATAGAKQNILNTAPAGGERNLAIQQADVNQGAQLGQLASQGYLGSFNALGQLGQSGIGQSQGAASTAISAGNAAGNQWGGIVNENNQSKGATLGAFGGLGSALGGLGGSVFGAAGEAGGFSRLFA
jgi:hypothetical protein